MKSLYLFIGFCLITGSHTVAQVTFDLPAKEKKNNSKAVLGSFSAGLGFINPSSVNKYIAEDVNSKTSGSVVFSTGSSNISISTVLNFSLVIRRGTHWQFKVPIEYGIASKNVTVNTSHYTYTMGRFSTGATVNYYIPINEVDNAIYFGGGMLAHFMTFSGFSATTLSPRIEMGTIVYRAKTDYEFFILGEFADGRTGDTKMSSINFSGFYFGVRFIF